MIRRGVRIAATALFLLTLAGPASAGTGKETNGPALRRLLLPYEGDQDVILTVSSIEWGVPDRWSFTTRYIHMFDRKAERDTKSWLSNLSVTLSPGTAGGRLGIGYLGVYSPNSSKPGADFDLLGEARMVLLRTWGQPLTAGADQSFAGGEVRISLHGMVVFGVGFYQRISGTADGQGTFWGCHVGIGM